MFRKIVLSLVVSVFSLVIIYSQESQEGNQVQIIKVPELENKEVQKLLEEVSQLGRGLEEAMENRDVAKVEMYADKRNNTIGKLNKQALKLNKEDVKKYDNYLKRVEEEEESKFGLGHVPILENKEVYNFLIKVDSIAYNTINGYKELDISIQKMIELLRAGKKIEHRLFLEEKHEDLSLLKRYAKKIEEDISKNNNQSKYGVSKVPPIKDKEAKKIIEELDSVFSFAQAKQRELNNYDKGMQMIVDNMSAMSKKVENDLIDSERLIKYVNIFAKQFAVAMEEIQERMNKYNFE